MRLATTKFRSGVKLLSRPPEPISAEGLIGKEQIL
jgi:hypothetical protein